MSSGKNTPFSSGDFNSDFEKGMILPSFEDLENDSDHDESFTKLVILDLNKVLFWRDSGYPKLLDEVPEKCKDLEAIKVNKGILYLRPNLEEFLDHCYTNYDVGFFTSMMGFNGRLMVERILTEEQFEQTKFIWCRDECDPCPAPTEKDKYPEWKPHSTVKKLDKVLNSFPKYEEDNVVFCDDSEMKLMFNPDSSKLIVPAFTEDTGSEDTTLIDLIDRLKARF